MSEQQKALDWFNANYVFRSINKFTTKQTHVGKKKIWWYPCTNDKKYLTQDKINEIALAYYKHAND